MTEREYTVTVNGGTVAYKGQRARDAYATFCQIMLRQSVIEATLTVRTYYMGRLRDERSFKTLCGTVAVTKLDPKGKL